jgi:hypothetical protein
VLLVRRSGRSWIGSEQFGSIPKTRRVALIKSLISKTVILMVTGMDDEGYWIEA